MLYGIGLSLQFLVYSIRVVADVDRNIIVKFLTFLSLMLGRFHGFQQCWV